MAANDGERKARNFAANIELIVKNDGKPWAGQTDERLGG
jgi:hypothetical protein